ncbi:MAG: Maf family protein [Oscillospiraceae bacterium]|nr:Maf family protein [Oscillospiraceae bacterium]
MGRIILASASPRRKELLGRIGLSCHVIHPNANEAYKGNSPGDTVSALSLRKAKIAEGQCLPGDVIIAADTIVWIDNGILGKPQSRSEAISMLQRLSGGWHRVYTGLTMLKDGRSRTKCEVTSVKMRSLSLYEIERYVDTGEPMDKAGGYGIQEIGSVFVERIDGDFYNVMGLPLCLLSQMFNEIGIDVV